ncbi:hypothetical protein J7426_01545 [Tropicibacter sp. R16_0]|nr:hypothetical protein [Tropicibacter sp. R16_0]MBO9448921.1 hypothetical protein [Tropicibacter sp. R16_0]
MPFDDQFHERDEPNEQEVLKAVYKGIRQGFAAADANKFLDSAQKKGNKK